VDITAGDRDVRAIGHPVWAKEIDDVSYIGVEFVELHPGDAETLQRFVETMARRPRIMLGGALLLTALLVFFILRSIFGSSPLEGTVEKLGESLESTTARIQTVTQERDNTQRRLEEKLAELRVLDKEVQALMTHIRDKATQADVTLPHQPPPVSAGRLAEKISRNLIWLQEVHDLLIQATAGSGTEKRPRSRKKRSK
jgi:hypothetical protein